MTGAMTVGWIGLGKLGLPMAARLAATGHAVAGYDRDAGRQSLAASQSIAVAPSVDAAAGHEVVFSSLPDDNVLRAVMLGAQGVLARMRRGAILAETSTVSAAASAAVAAEAERYGVRYLRLPMSGNPTLAVTGQLTCFASGPRAAYDAVVPLAATFTRAQKYLGEGEEARYAKFAVNLMIAVSAGMMAESLALARKGNIAWHDILSVLEDSAVASPMVKYKVPPLRQRDFASTFSCRQMAKDLDLVLEAGEETGVPLRLAALTREIYAGVIDEGDGDADYIATVKRIEREAGLGEPPLAGTND